MAKSSSRNKPAKSPKLNALPEWNLDDLYPGIDSPALKRDLALADVADGIRSAAEADLKDLLVKARLPLPLFNPSLYAADGTFIARPDGWWPELGIAIEVDSLEWHLSPQDYADTLARGRRMAKYQIVTLRFTPKQIRTDPATVIRDIREALEGARRAAHDHESGGQGTCERRIAVRSSVAVRPPTMTRSVTTSASSTRV